MIRVVICDDNIVFMNHFKDIVESSLSKYTDDFQISTVSNGNLLLAKHMESEFDIIFLDIDMPDISGFDVAKVLRDNNSRCFLIPQNSKRFSDSEESTNPAVTVAERES